MSKLTKDEALSALNVVRSNVVETQNASWSNTMYPLVAILDAAGIERIITTEEQQEEHRRCYGGAGGYPGHIVSDPPQGWRMPFSQLQSLKEAIDRYVENPTEKNLNTLIIRRNN